MKNVVLNVLGLVVGYLILACLFPLVMVIINFVISIPVLGDILRFGTEPAYIVFPYTAFITSALSIAAAYFICPRNAKGRKIGVIILGVLMFLSYAATTISLFRENGYDFVFIVFAIAAIICSGYCVVLGIEEL